MNRIEKIFSDLRQKKEKALVGFVTAGDPSPVRSQEIVLAMCRSGLDILELGVPFSDPTADGPVIQRSSQRALENGTSLQRVLHMTRDIRNRTDVPIVLFSYYNPIYKYGAGRFFSEATAAGADGALVVDLPPEESDEMTMEWSGADLALIRLVAPTTPPERMRRIAETGAGFLYLVSKTGVTGSDGLDPAGIAPQVDALREITPLPICVGFGISTPQEVAAIAGAADGVVVGSAFERMIEENIAAPDLPDRVADFARELKAATLD